MIWKDTKTNELQSVISQHKGYGESKEFYLLREEICQKLGKVEWERMLRKAKVMASTLNKK